MALTTEQQIPQSPLEGALAYAKCGYSIFPVNNQKKPLVSNGFKDSSIDEEVIKAWWQKFPSANVAIDCQKSQLLVIDLDRHTGKADGLANFKNLEGYKPAKEAPLIVTGGGGRHLVFQDPGVPVKGTLGQGIDIKSNGYIVAPPSLHESGERYKAEPGRSLIDLIPPPVPEWLLKHLLKDDRPNTTVIAEEQPIHSYPQSSAEQVVANCKFMKHFVDDAASLTEPEWYQGIGVLAYTQESPEIIHDYSSAYAGFSSEETEQKIQHWRDNGIGPATCRTIQEKCGESFCSGCPFNGKIKSPITLGYSMRPLTESVVKPKPFPPVMPGIFRDFAKGAASAIQCPEDYVACAILALVSTLIGTSARLQIKPEWETYGNLYIGIVGTPSAKKSPAMNIVFNFLKPIETIMAAKFEEEKSIYNFALKIYQSDYKSWQKSPEGNQPEEPKKPQLKQIRTSDTTVEALCDLLQTNGHGMGIVCDELSLWIRSIGQYKGGGGSDRSHYLSAWNNAPITVNRKGKEAVYLPAPYLTIFGGIQPDVLKEVSKNESIQDGLIERFLMACPEKCSQPPNKGVAIDQAIKKAFTALINQLFDQRSTEDMLFKFSDQAAEAFVDAETKWHQAIKSADFPSEMEAYYAKAPSQLGRIILLLHLMKNLSESKKSEFVSKQTVEEARQLTDYFLAHAHTARNMLTQNKDEHQVERAISWIQAKAMTCVGPRDIYTYKVAGCKTRSSAVALLRKIHDYGYGQWAEKEHHLVFPSDLSPFL